MNQELYEETLTEVNQEQTASSLHAVEVSLPYFQPLLWSLLLSTLSVANPFLTFLATNQQSQNLYAGWAQSQGLVAYGHIYGSGGLLFYLAAWAGSLVFGAVLFAALQVVLLWFMGREVFRLGYSLSGQENFAVYLIHLSYAFVFLLGFGGLYASIFALPFIFGSLNHLITYLRDGGTDKGFIRYGAMAALAFLMDPLSALVFYGLVFLVLLVYNLLHQRKARGLYQLLASLLGFSLVFYPLGYYTVWKGTFGLAISQVLYPLESLSLHSDLLVNIFFYGGIVLGLGWLAALVVNSIAMVDKQLRLLSFLGILGLLVVLILAVFQADRGAYQLIPALPFAVLLVGIWLSQQAQSTNRARHGRSRQTNSAWSVYLKGSWYLPILVGLYLLGSPLVQATILSSQVSAEREAAASYIKKQAQASDRIYAWDDTAVLYQASGHLAGSNLLTPSLYMQTSENLIQLENQLQESQPAYILVKKDLPVFAPVQKLLKENYKKTSLKLDKFTLYQLK